MRRDHCRLHIVENVKMSPFQVYDLLYETIQKDGIKGVLGFFYAIYKETAEKW